MAIAWLSVSVARASLSALDAGSYYIAPGRVELANVDKVGLRLLPFHSFSGWPSELHRLQCFYEHFVVVCK